MDKIAKDVGDIQSRLLHHRPIINAEIRYFVREFEEKRGHRESRLLENLSKMVVEANEQMLPTNLEGTNQDMMSNIIKRCKSSLSDSHFALQLCFENYVISGIT
uniref:Biogenesis of lysosome-related organelles complex 1 subunit 5 n=1 Tax=Lates calcarifer TaxID=8187 RepID=A0A4W6D1H7_LATCA